MSLAIKAGRVKEIKRISFRRWSMTGWNNNGSIGGYLRRMFG
jgi:hypothetical protein